LSKVALRRSLRQTKIMIVLKGNPQDTEDQLKKIYEAVTK
jgi:hypothetical protein